jgi:hypothetical protein
VFSFGLSTVFFDDRDGDGQIDAPWELILLEGDVGPTTAIRACHESGGAPNCLDASLFGGVRYRFRRHPEQRPWPFLNVQLGGYWRGTGLPDVEYEGGRFALQGGGGLEFRWPNTIQGFRVSVDLRYVFGHDLTQVRVLGLYMLSPRRR